MAQKKVDYLKDLEILTAPNSDYGSVACGKLALDLLTKVPGARETCLEALFRFFLKASQNHFNNIGGQSSESKKKHTGEVDDICSAAKDCLSSLVLKSPKTWLRVVLKWSVQLLTSMAVQSRASGAGYFSAPLEDTITSWYLNCLPSHMAMSMLEHCVAQVFSQPKSSSSNSSGTVSSNITPMSTDEVMQQIISLVKDNLPVAEWIVAHLGVKHPEVILPALVDLALKQMHEQCDANGIPIHLSSSQKPPTANAASSNGFKLNFVESISYLSKFHRRLVQIRIMSPLKNAILSIKTRYSLLCFNFVLFSCEKFPSLLACCLEYCAEVLDVDFLEKCMQTFEKAFEHVEQSRIDAIVEQCIGLLMKNSTSSATIFKFFLEVHCKSVSKRIHKRHHVFLHNFAHYWLLDVQRTAQTRFFSNKLALNDQLFITELIRTSTFLTEVYWFMPIHEQAFFVRFYLRALCLAEGDLFAAKLVIDLMSHDFYRASKFLEVLAIVKEIHLALPNFYYFFVTKISLLMPNYSKLILVCLKSLIHLFCLQSEDAENHKNKLTKPICRNLSGFLKFLTFSSLSVNRYVLQFFTLVSFDKLVDDYVLHVYKMSSALTHSIINVMCNERDVIKRTVTEQLLVTVTSRFCSLLPEECANCFRTVFLRSLFELTVSPNYCSLFGGTVSKETNQKREKMKSQMIQTTYISLLQQNRTINRGKCSSTPISLNPFPCSHNSSAKQSSSSPGASHRRNWTVYSNCRFIFQLLTNVCDLNVKDSKQQSKSSKKLDENLVLLLARAMTLHVCPQVSHSCNTWPDINTEKNNLDRNIKIYNQFDENPMFWVLLDLFAQVRPVICHVPILLFSLLHVLITLWESNRKSESKSTTAVAAESEPKLVEYTCRLLSAMDKAQLIPKQLSVLEEIVALVTPYEVASILTFCWKYIQDSPPDVDSYVVSTNAGGYAEKQFMKILSQQFTDSIHLIFLSNISQLGPYFPKCLSVQTSKFNF